MNQTAPAISTPDLCDAHPDRVQVLEPMLHGFGGRAAFGGEIRTVKCYEDNSFVKQCLAEPGAGRVLVVDGGGSVRRALLGGDVAATAAANGWAGVIIYGCVRDVDELCEIDLGIQALGAVPMKTKKRNVGELDVPLNFGGVNFHGGDWVYADNNGVIVADGELKLEA
ncbi:MAG: ribonuclease E activity regulator RraA [Halofilum sp. (in: g-proteobacteria)]|nr:ribonuclease E activity regulator RraA [Halofilum sp. (in: g-proteobacteria)]